MSIAVRRHESPKDRWLYLDHKKHSIHSLCEEYARWTLPYVYPATNSENVELQLSKDSIGAAAVNHLANKVVSVLFPPQRMFFRLSITEQMKQQAMAAIAAAGAPNAEEASAAVARALVQLEEQLATAEKKAQDYMDMVQYRPQAVNAAKLLIVTGNALEYHPEGRPVQVYTLRDYCIVRDLGGEVIEIMTKECKTFETFHPEIQEQIRHKGLHKVNRNGYEDKADVTIYTRIKLEEDGRFHVTQSADDVMLDTTGAFFTKAKLPWIPLTWNLIRGEDYGRGLVADFAGAFHAVNVLSGSLLNIAAIMGDIKFLVDPASTADIGELNRAATGTFHSGRPDSIKAIQLDKQADAQFIAQMIERYERQLNQAFLLNSALTRNAERVTAEEIRMQANELETSNGGIYSRLAATWQGQLASILLDQTDFQGTDMGILPKVITGMDSLSRAGELDNLQAFFAYLGMLNTVPEPVLQTIRMPDLLAIIGTNLQVEYKKFTKTTAEMQAEMEQAMAQQQQLQQQETDGQAQVAASKEAVKG